MKRSLDAFSLHSLTPLWGISLLWVAGPSKPNIRASSNVRMRAKGVNEHEYRALQDQRYTMDPAVGMVESYLRVNGYFTVTEYPIVEASKYGEYRTATDLDVLAFRFPGAGRLVPFQVG